MSDRVKDLEKALADAKAEANQIRRTTKFEEVKKYIGLVYYYAHVSPRGTGFSLIHIKNIILKDNDRLESHQDEVTCSLSPHCNDIKFGKNIEYYDLYSFYPGFMRSSTTVSLDVFKKMKHRAKISVKSFMEIMKTLTELKIPIVPADNMSEEHMKFDVDFPHIKLDNLMGFLDHTPFTIGNKYLLTPKSVEFAYAKIRDYRHKDAACSGLYEPCDSSYLERMHEVISSIDRQLLNFSTGK